MDPITNVSWNDVMLFDLSKKHGYKSLSLLFTVFEINIPKYT
jgi:hypothetical protein